LNRQRRSDRVTKRGRQISWVGVARLGKKAML
jgi:hypothetical protein